MNTRTHEYHPELQKARDAINLPEVQAMIRELSRHGLAVGIPHMHNEEGEHLPLPRDLVSFERDLQVSFLSHEDPEVKSSIPVMWRWDNELRAAAACTGCGGAHCRFD